MKGEYVLTTISRGPLESKTKPVLAHEVPLLRARHGDENVVVLSEGGAHSSAEVVPDEEYTRLESVYGMMPDGRFLVEHVYGRRGSGQLRSAIAKGMKGIPDLAETLSEDTAPEPDEAPSDVRPEVGIIEQL